MSKILTYFPDTGKFVWQSGKEAGYLDQSGYIKIQLDGKNVYAHRLAFTMSGLECPKFVDHINGNRADNRLENLRAATRSLNNQNLHVCKKSNKVGYLGVRKRGNKFTSTIRVDGKQQHLGYFNTPEEAYEKYLSVKRLLHEGCTI